MTLAPVDVKKDRATAASWSRTRSEQHAAGTEAVDLAFRDDDLPVNEHPLDSLAVAVRLSVRSAIANTRRIESNDVGPLTLADETAIREPDDHRGKAGRG